MFAAMQAREGKLSLVSEKETRGCVYSLNVFQVRFFMRMFFMSPPIFSPPAQPRVPAAAAAVTG